MKVIKVSPLYTPVVLDTVPSLDFIKRDIGASIIDAIPQDETVAIIYDVEAREKDLIYNRVLFEEGEPYDIIRGTFYIVAMDEDGELIDLTPSQVGLYKTMFKEIDNITEVGDKLMDFRLNGFFPVKERA